LLLSFLKKDEFCISLVDKVVFVAGLLRDERKKNNTFETRAKQPRREREKRTLSLPIR